MSQLVPLVKVINLGRIPYRKALSLQNLLQQKHLTKPEEADQTLLIVEHDPVYTLGQRETVDENEVKRLVDCGAEVVKSDRGGLTTFHGPGQLVAYPIFNLQTFRNLSLKKYVGMLEMTGIHTCRMMGINAVNGHESVAHTGAWVGNNKICAIGIQCKNSVTKHGLALNCNTDLKWFQNIVPCGIVDKGVTSLSKELGKDVEISSVLPQFLSSFQSIFICDMEFVEYKGDEESNDAQSNRIG